MESWRQPRDSSLHRRRWQWSEPLHSKLRLLQRQQKSRRRKSQSRQVVSGALMPGSPQTRRAPLCSHLSCFYSRAELLALCRLPHFRLLRIELWAESRRESFLHLHTATYRHVHIVRARSELTYRCHMRVICGNVNARRHVRMELQLIPAHHSRALQDIQSLLHDPRRVRRVFKRSLRAVAALDGGLRHDRSG